MASRRGLGLSSDPEFLLELMQELPDASESEDEFDGYLDPEDGPVILRRFDRDEELQSPVSRARSLDSLCEAREMLDHEPESPLSDSSPSLSPMQVQVAGGSPAQSPMEQRASASSTALLALALHRPTPAPPLPL